LQLFFQRKHRQQRHGKVFLKYQLALIVIIVKPFFLQKKNKSFLSLRELTTFSLLQNEKVIKSIQQYFLMVFSLMINVCSKAITVF